MRYKALACDYDGTIASQGIVAEETVAALERVRASGRRLILVTGRQLEDLLTVFPGVEVFDRVVAENGAVLYRPAGKEMQLLAEAPPQGFVEALRAKDVAPLAVGHVIVATWTPHENVVLETIRNLGLEMQVIFNKGAVMVLPSGVNKQTGLRKALAELDLSPHNVVAVGDGENDHALITHVECGAAVANALPVLQERADIVTLNRAGTGVAELADRLVANDLVDVEPRLSRHEILLGKGADGAEVRLPPYGINVLIVGASGSGKSTLTVGLLERLAEKAYQFCLVDPEGHYEELAEAVSLGDSQRPPTIDEIMQILRRPAENAAVNILGLTPNDRPAFFSSLIATLRELRARTARPHWIVVDEAHHVLPHVWAGNDPQVPTGYQGVMLVTLTAEGLVPAALKEVDVVIAVGASPRKRLAEFARAVGRRVPNDVPSNLDRGEALAWFHTRGERPIRFTIAPCQQVLRRHRRKYAVGSVGDDRSFCFRGPRGKMNLRAQNLRMFLQLAEGVDDATWMHHLRRHDYSDWFRRIIKDDALAEEAESVENTPGISAHDSHFRIGEAIERRYTAPATSGLRP